MEDPAELAVALRLLWTGVDDAPVHAANQFIVQVHEGDVVLTAGMLTPPVILPSTTKEEIERLQEAGYVQVRTVARLALSRRRLGELVIALQQSIAIYDRQEEQQGAPDDD